MQQPLHAVENVAPARSITFAHRLSIKRHVGILFRTAPMAGFDKFAPHAKQRYARVARTNRRHGEAMEAAFGEIIVAGAELHISIGRALLERERQSSLARCFLQDLKIATDFG